MVKDGTADARLDARVWIASSYRNMRTRLVTPDATYL